MVGLFYYLIPKDSSSWTNYFSAGYLHKIYLFVFEIVYKVEFDVKLFVIERSLSVQHGNRLTSGEQRHVLPHNCITSLVQCLGILNQGG